MSVPLTLVSHTLCPYVQRAAIALTEKRVSFARRYVDLANKPVWFLWGSLRAIVRAAAGTMTALGR